MTEVEWTPKTLDLLEGLDTEAQERLVKKLDEAKDWTSHRLEKFSGHPYYKLRASDYRAIITWDREEAVLIVVPKSPGGVNAIPENLVLGYSRGYADRLAHEFSDPADWRGRRVHILGGSPPKRLDAIRQLTRSMLSADPPADIVGLDWNGLHRGAQFGEFWTADGWDDSGCDAGHVTVRKTVRHSLAHVREFSHSEPS